MLLLLLLLLLLLFALYILSLIVFPMFLSIEICPMVGFDSRVFMLERLFDSVKCASK